MNKQHREKSGERKERENKGQGASNNSNNEGSSSDTDKSSSLFKTSGGGIELSRIKELPVSFYNGYASLDEFLSAASTSDNQNQHQSESSSSKDEKTVSKHHHLHPYYRKLPLQVTGSLVTSNRGVFNTNSKTKSAESAMGLSSKIKQRHAQDVIDEMNRQYDHNLCLDRFINEMEKMQTKKQKEVENQQCNDSPSNSSIYSSVAPRSNEDTDSSSRNSDSIKSSTPENRKAEKAENNRTGRKEEKPVNASSSEEQKTKAKAKPKQDPKSSMSSLQHQTSSLQHQTSSVSEKQSVYTESGIELTGGSYSSGAQSTSSAIEAGNEEKNSKNYKGGKLGRKRKRGYIYNPKPVTKKQSKSIVPVEAKDQSYWSKRQRNNEAARKSREMRREKVNEIHGKLVRLKKENEALRVAITLLIQRNESLETVIDEFEKTESRSTARPLTIDAPQLNCQHPPPHSFTAHGNC